MSHFSVPDDLPGRLFDQGLGPDHVGLLMLAWSESSRYLLDGRLARSRVRALRGWTKPREAALIAAGAWIDHGDALELTDYLRVNRTKADIESRKLIAAQNGRHGGIAAATTPRTRDSSGHFAPKPVDTEREDIAAFIERWHKPPSARQRKILDDVLARHDVSGPAWAAEIMRAHPDDPIGAVLAADRAWRAERIEGARADEVASQARRLREPEPWELDFRASLVAHEKALA